MSEVFRNEEDRQLPRKKELNIREEPVEKGIDKRSVATVIFVLISFVMTYSLYKSFKDVSWGSLTGQYIKGMIEGLLSSRALKSAEDAANIIGLFYGALIVQAIFFGIIVYFLTKDKKSKEQVVVYVTSMVLIIIMMITNLVMFIF